MIYQGQILKLSYLRNIWPDRKKITRVSILWMIWCFVNDIWSTFCFRHMLQSRSGVTFGNISMIISLSQRRNGILGHTYMLGWCSGLHSIYCMEFAKFEVTRTQVWFKLWSSLLHLFKNIWNTDRLMANRTDGARRDYTLWPRAKMEHGRRIQY